MIKQFVKKLWRIDYLYLFAIFVTGLLFVAIITTRKYDYDNKGMMNFEDISGQIRLTEDGEEIADLTNLGQYVEPGSTSLSLFYTVPKSDKDYTLIYRSKDVYTSVYVKELYTKDYPIYETKVPTSPFYNRSPGNIWNRVNIEKKYSGKTLEIKIDLVYDDNAVTADNFYFGDGADIITNYVHKRLISILISMFTMLLGLALIILNFMTHNKNFSSGHSLLYIGIYAFFIGIWSLLETNVIQFFTTDQRIYQLLGNLIMITGTLPLFLYLDHIYHILKKKGTRLFCSLDLAYIWVSIFGQFTGLFDFHQVLIGAQIALVLSLFYIIGWLVYLYIINKRSKEDMLPIILQLVGVFLLICTALISVVASINGDSVDRAGPIRVGMLFFIIFFSASSQIQSNRLIIKGMKYNVVKTLAYKDGLTNLGNRTAYLEKIDYYEHHKHMNVGIVYLDINNLKQVNDKTGHEMGDLLIQTGAKIIQKSFGECGYVYRIGGDEFCVFIEKDNCVEQFEAAESKFIQYIAACNKGKILPFKVQIAHGFAHCEDVTAESLKEAISIADQEMYKNKAALKAQK